MSSKKNQSLVLSHVTHTPATADQIAERCGLRWGLVRTALDRLMDADKVVAGGAGHYQLATPELLAERDRREAEEEAAEEAASAMIEAADIETLRLVVARTMTDSEVRDEAERLIDRESLAALTERLREADFQRRMLALLPTRAEMDADAAAFEAMTTAERYHAFLAAQEGAAASV